MRQLILCSLALSLAQVFIGVNIVIGKYLTGFMSMYTFIFIRFFICAGLLAYFYYRKSFTLAEPTHPQGGLTTMDWVYMIAQGLSAGLCFNLLFYYGLQFTTATSAGIVACSLPPVMALMAVIFLREAMTTQKAAAIVLVMIGIVIINIDNMVLGTENSGSFFGDALVFLAMIPEALFSIFSKKVTSRVTEWGTALISGVVTSLGIAPFLFYAPPSPQALPGFFSWPWLACPLLLLSGLLTLAFYILWSYGLKKIPVSTAGIFGGLVSIVTSLLGYFFLGENFGVCDGIGLVVVFTALFLGTYKLNRYSMTKNV